MSQTLSDDEDMMSSPSSPATPINTTSNPHLPSHLDLKTPPQSQDNTPYASRVNTTSFPQAPTSSSTTSASGGGSATLQTSSSTASATFHDLDSNSGSNITSDMIIGNAAGAVGSASGSASVSTGGGGGGRRRQHSQMTLAGIQGNNPVSIMQSTEAGVPMWLTKRGLEEIHNVEERLLDRGFNTHLYASIFNDKDMNIK